MGPVVYRARWVLPVATPPILDGEILVDGDGTIVAVAPVGAIDLPQDVTVEDLGDAILLPGLVNVHAHPELAMFRGALEDLPFREWILRLVAARRGALLPGDSLAAARWTMVEAIRAGITTIAATEASGSGLEAMVEAGVRGILYQEVFGPDPLQVEASIAQLRADVERLLPLTTDRVTLGVSPHAPYTVADELYRETSRIARDARLPIAVHIAESDAERRLVVDGEGDFAPGLRARGIPTPSRARSPIELLARLGILELRPLLIHCVDIDADDIARIAESGSAVAHCPVANAKLGHGVAPVMRLRAAGVRVGLGTDSVGSNNRLDLLEEARIAALFQRALERRPDVLTPAELLRLCTIDGARALGLEDRTGTLEPGKAADLCAVSVGGVATTPVHDPVATLFHSARASDVVLTVVDGVPLYRSGKVLSFDEGNARRGILEAAYRLQEGGL